MTSSTGRSWPHPAALALAAALSIGAGSTALPPNAVAQEAASAVQDVALQDVVLAFGDAKITAPTLMVSGTRLSKDDLLAILKVDGKEPLASRLAKLDAASFGAPELRVEYPDGADRMVQVFRDVSAKGVHGGKIAELTAAGAALVLERAPGSDKSVAKGSYGKLRLEEADLAALARLYNEPGDGKAPLQRIYAAFSIDRIAFGDEEASLAIESVAGRDLMARQIPAGWSGAITRLAALDPDGGDEAETARASGVAADLVEGVSVGGFEAKGLSFRTVKPEQAELGLGRLAFLGSGPDAGLILSDFGFEGSGTRMKLGSVKLAGFSLAPTIATLRRLSQSSELPKSELRRLTPEIGTLTLSGFSLDVPQDAGRAASADPLPKDKPAETMHFGLREAAFTGGPLKDGVPTASRMSLSGLSLPGSLVAEVPGLAGLGTYGYRDLDFDLVADSAWNETAKELTLREVSLSGKDMGRLRLSAVLGGVGPEIFDPDAAVSGLAMLSTTAKALDVTVENGGLFERFIDATAKSLSLKPDELRKEYVTACVIGVPAILGNSPAAKTVGAAMGKFVTKPNRLTITARAKNGTGLGAVDLSSAATPAALLDKLDVNAKAE